MVGRGVMIPPFSLVGVWRIPSSTPSRCRHRLQCSCNCAATGASSSRQSSAIPRLHTASPHSRPVEVQIVLRSQVMSTKKPAAKRAGKTAKEQVPAVLPKKALVNGPQKQVFILDGQSLPRPAEMRASFAVCSASLNREVQGRSPER
jgi:hypothetical protein